MREEQKLFKIATITNALNNKAAIYRGVYLQCLHCNSQSIFPSIKVLCKRIYYALFKALSKSYGVHFLNMKLYHLVFLLNILEFIFPVNLKPWETNWRYSLKTILRNEENTIRNKNPLNHHSNFSQDDIVRSSNTKQSVYN